jgi:hypothetical protein
MDYGQIKKGHHQNLNPLEVSEVTFFQIKNILTKPNLSAETITLIECANIPVYLRDHHVLAYFPLLT